MYKKASLGERGPSAALCECDVIARRLEQARAPLQLVAAPLRQAVEVLAPDLQDGLELRVRQVALQHNGRSVGRPSVRRRTAPTSGRGSPRG